MKTALINASPKRTGSASGMLLDALYPRLEGCSCTEFRLGIEKPDPQILETFADFDALVFAFPLYVDGLPAHLLRHLQALEPLLCSGRARTGAFIRWSTADFTKGGRLPARWR